MARDHTTTFSVIIGGMERDLEVSFEVESYGTMDSWEEPGDPPSIVINEITDAETGRDLYAFCEKARDLWGNEPKAGPINLYHGPARFNPYYREGKGDGPSFYSAWAQVTLNMPTILDMMYEEICVSRMPDYEPMDDDYYSGSSYYPDYRDEHSV